MPTEPSSEIEAELAALRERVAQQEAELAALRSEPSSGATRRALFKGAGAVAGGVALASVVGGSSAAAAERAPGVDVPRAAMPIALYLKSNGEVISGESTRDGAIDCVSADVPLRMVIDEKTGLPTGRRIYDGIRLRKGVDAATPLIARALCNNETIQGTIKFFRPSPTGDGTTEQYFTIEFKGGRVAFLEQISPDGYSNASAETPPVGPFEDVNFVFQTITWRYEPTGAEHTDTWNARV